MSKLKLLLLALASLLFLRIGLYVFQETHAGCNNQSSQRAKTICESIAKHREWTFNPHTFTPSYYMPFSNYRSFWCETNPLPEDLITFKTMSFQSERSISKSLDWLVSLLESETTGAANDSSRGSIFDPKMDSYIRKERCPI